MDGTRYHVKQVVLRRGHICSLHTKYTYMSSGRIIYVVTTVVYVRTHVLSSWIHPNQQQSWIKLQRRGDRKPARI